MPDSILTPSLACMTNCPSLGLCRRDGIDCHGSAGNLAFHRHILSGELVDLGFVAFQGVHLPVADKRKVGPVVRQNAIRDQLSATPAGLNG